MFTRVETEHYQRVKEFMRKAGQLPTQDGPHIPDAKIRLLRAKLIFEEAMEAINGLGIAATRTGTVISSVDPDGFGQLGPEIQEIYSRVYIWNPSGLGC